MVKGRWRVFPSKASYAYTGRINLDNRLNDRDVTSCSSKSMDLDANPSCEHRSEVGSVFA